MRKSRRRSPVAQNYFNRRIDVTELCAFAPLPVQSGRRRLRVSDRMLDVPVSEKTLDAAGIDAAVRQIVPA